MKIELSPQIFEKYSNITVHEMVPERKLMRGTDGQTESLFAILQTRLMNTAISLLTFEKWDEGAWTGSIWLRIRTGDGFL